MAAGRIFALFGPGIGVMLLYNTHGWIHLSIGCPERWFRWGLLEFVCTATLFLVTLPWGPSGIAFAWTASYFILMLPGLWYAGKPVGLGIGAMVAVIWKYFVASVVAGAGDGAYYTRDATHLLPLRLRPQARWFGLVVVSVIFFGLYLAGITRASPRRRTARRNRWTCARPSARAGCCAPAVGCRRDGDCGKHSARRLRRWPMRAASVGADLVSNNIWDHNSRKENG